MIPSFDSNGNLPPGIHLAELANVLDRFGSQNYGARLNRTRSLKAFIELATPYIQALYIDGSYITSKLSPGDVDLAIVVKDDISKEGMDQLILFSNMFKGDLHIFPYKKGMQQLINMITFWTKDRDQNSKGIILMELGK
jgi:hypothetical protein